MCEKERSMNIQLYPGHYGNPFLTGPADRPPEPVSDTAVSRPGNYDRATFYVHPTSGSDDASFARILAKNITRQLTAQHAPDPEHLIRLKKQVADGSYQPDDMAIVQAMLKR